MQFTSRCFKSSMSEATDDGWVHCYLPWCCHHLDRNRNIDLRIPLQLQVKQLDYDQALNTVNNPLVQGLDDISCIGWKAQHSMQPCQNKTKDVARTPKCYWWHATNKLQNILDKNPEISSRNNFVSSCLEVKLFSLFWVGENIEPYEYLRRIKICSLGWKLRKIEFH